MSISARLRFVSVLTEGWSTCHVDKCSTVAGNVSKDKLYVLLAAYKCEIDNVYIPENCSCYLIGVLSCFFLVLC